MKYTIRLATEADGESLSRLKREMWETTYRGIYPDEKIDNFDYAKNRDAFVELIRNPDVEFYVVEDERKTIGYMDFGIPQRKFMDYKQEIGLLYVLKEYQGKGVGTELFRLAYDGIRKNGFDEFFISCNKYNLPAQKFYERMGGMVIHVDEDHADRSVPQVKYLYRIER